MKVEIVILVRLDPAEQRRLLDLGLMSLEQALSGQGFLERRFPLHSEEARLCIEELEASETEYYVREERQFSRKELRSAQALHLDSFHHHPDDGVASVASE
ncbi:MAG: hypothetical protein KDB53_20085, partial [Planctomycetes bacterium]|nr:hypothetical protein [Planctomycetota bacterium]